MSRREVMDMGRRKRDILGRGVYGVVKGMEVVEGDFMEGEEVIEGGLKDGGGYWIGGKKVFGNLMGGWMNIFWEKVWMNEESF